MAHVLVNGRTGGRRVKTRLSRVALVIAAALCVTGVRATQQVAGDPLPSWNDGPPKRAIIDFVDRVTRAAGPDYVNPAERIATFDNDGTLWAEQPLYVQLAFALDRVKVMAPLHPEWKLTEPFRSFLIGDPKAALAGGDQAAVKLLMTTHAGMTSDEFDAIVRQWIITARDPRFRRPYTELVYLPMLELLSYLRSNGFKNYIVSGGGVDFMRPWVETTYGISPEHVIGSRIKLKYEMRDTMPVLIRLPEADFIDDKSGKVIGIAQAIGRRPIAAFGNSDGDLQMLQWTTTGPGARFGLIVHHTDADREWAYDRDSDIGRLAKALDQAPARGWTVVDMKRDWKTIFPLENSAR